MKIKKKFVLFLAFVMVFISLSSISFANSEHVPSNVVEEDLISADGLIPPEPIRESIPITIDGLIPPEPIRE